MKKLFSIVLLLSVMSVFADENHYINFFIGDRAAGLGGAYTAIADGPEGVFYNPAGLAYAGNTYFSLSVNAIQYKMLYYHNVFTTTDNKPFDYVRHSFSFILNFFGFVQKAKNFTFALTISSPDSEFFDQRDNATVSLDLGPTRLNVNYNYSDMVYDIGPSFAFLIDKHVSVGFNFFLSYRDRKTITQTTYLHESDELHFFQTGSFYDNERIFGVKQQFGIQIMPIKELSMGYSIAVAADILSVSSSQTTDIYTVREYDTGSGYWMELDKNWAVRDNKFNVYNIAQHGLFKPLFIHQRLGFAYFINKAALVSLDGMLYIPIQMYNKGELVSVELENGKYEVSTADQNERLNIVGNVATGFEYYFTPNFPFRIGAFTNFSNTRPLKDSNNDDIEDSGIKNAKDHIHMFGGSVSVGFSTSDMSINLGASVSGGIGKAQILDDSTTLQKLGALTVNLFLSGGYQF